MPKISDLKLTYRLLMKAYRWRTIDPVPLAHLNKPATECRVALVTTGGMVTPAQLEFDHSLKGGDFSYRVISADVDVSSLIESHRSDAFDHSGIERDKNMALPLDRLHELKQEGAIGEVAPRHLSFMGSVTAPGRLLKQTAPEAAQILVDDQVDAALLVPV